MPNQENDTQEWEERLPAISGQAFAEARQRTLASGQSVLITRGTSIYRLQPDGREVFVKTIEHPCDDIHDVRPGTVLYLR